MALPDGSTAPLKTLRVRSGPGQTRRQDQVHHQDPSNLHWFRWPAAKQIFSRARVDGFAFDGEVLWLARQLHLEVAEVQVQALERQGSKVQMVADALEMLGEVWAVRQAAPHRGGSARWDLP